MKQMEEAQKEMITTDSNENDQKAFLVKMMVKQSRAQDEIYF